MSAPAPADTTAPRGADPVSRSIFTRISLVDTLLVPALAVVTALVLGAVVIALSDLDALRAGDVGAMASTIGRSYKALFAGAFNGVGPWSETLVYTTPLLLAGLAVSLAFKAGLFNIGATGQMLAGGAASVYVGFSMNGPGVVQIPLAVLAGLAGGAMWGGIVGVLKARTGAHEVITTIMLNYIALDLVGWLLKTSVYARPGRQDGISKEVTREGRLPHLLQFLANPGRVHIGVLIAVAAAAGYWLLLRRTRLGFELRTLGANPDAARYAGMRPGTLTVTAMLMAGGLAGLAGATEVLGTQGRMTGSFAGNIGFDAIAVALLGRSTPSGTALAAFLFGALQAGGQRMQAETGVPIDLILVLRALIVLFVAATALTKLIWRVKAGARSGSQQTFQGWGI